MIAAFAISARTLRKPLVNNLRPDEAPDLMGG